MRGDTMKHKDVMSAYNAFVRNVDEVPEGINLFNPHPACVNFLDGTLHIRQSKEHEYSFEFLPHRREDFVTNLFPYTYKDCVGKVNQAFEAALERVFAGDPDKDQKKRAIMQMMGAALVPFRPHVFMLYGPPKTGKSTFIQITEKLVCPDNHCSVEPHQFNGFNMETMVGKLVNSETDITTTHPISDAQIKKIIDRRKFRIRRKGKVDAYGFIPAVHIFGGNEIPPTLEGRFRAHDRRWTFIEFKNVQGEGNRYDQDYWSFLWDQSPEGIVGFALKGLADLIAARGHFINPDSGVTKMEEWQNRGDMVGQFLQAVNEGEVSDQNDTVMRGENLKTERVKLWLIFKKWVEDENATAPKMSRKAFYDELRNKKVAEKKIVGVRYFGGIGLKVSDNSDF
jgi:phage/plasmid-associated DNA primase